MLPRQHIKMHGVTKGYYITKKLPNLTYTMVYLGLGLGLGLLRSHDPANHRNSVLRMYELSARQYYSSF